MSEAVPSTSGNGGGGGEPPSSVEHIHGVVDLPDGYGKILNAAAMLANHCSNAEYKIVYMDNPKYMFFKCCENAVAMLVRCCKLPDVYLLHICHIYLVNSL